MKPFHIHRFKIKDIFLEQPVLDIYGKHLTFADRLLYYDYIVKKCRCGKEKKELINIYSADTARISLYSNPDITYNGLVNKISLI